MIFSVNSPNSVLAIGAHPDDIEYGCGGLLQRFENVTGVVVTDGGSGNGKNPKKRIAEMEKSAAFLDYDLIRLGMEDTRVDVPELIQHLDRLIATHQPDMILFHHADDVHQDHRAVADAVLSACRGFCGEMLAYATPSSRNFNPSVLVELTPQEWEKKLEAVLAHVSQRAQPYLFHGALQVQFCKWPTTVYRGLPNPAEPFVLLRSIIHKKGE